MNSKQNKNKENHIKSCHNQISENNKGKISKASCNTSYRKLSSENSTFRKEKNLKNTREIFFLDKQG